MKLVELTGDFGLLLPGAGPGFLLQEGCDGSGLFPGHGAFGDRHDAEVLPGPAPVTDRFCHGFQIIGDLRDEHHIGPAGQSGLQGEPSGPMAHDLNHDHPVVAGGSGVNPVDRLGGDGEGGIETEGDIGSRHIIIDRLGKGDDLQARLLQAEGVFLSAASPQADQGVQVVALVGVYHRAGHVLGPAADGHFVWFVPAGSQDRSAIGQDPREHLAVQLDGPGRAPGR